MNHITSQFLLLPMGSILKIRAPQRIFKRYASTDQLSPYHHEDWPKKTNPSPYEVLNVSKSVSMKELRKQYYKLAKVYHPDISSKTDHIDHEGRQLSSDNKLERFKLLTDAYNLLRDDKRRALYDQYKMGWGLSETLLGDAFHSQRRQQAYATNRTYAADFNDHAYWSASNWEDYENLRKNYKPLSRDEKIKVLLGIFFIMAASASLQGWYILETVEKDLLEKKRIHENTEYDLSLASMNYGLDDTRLARIRRFLWFRTFGLYVDKESLDKGAMENDHLLNEVIGPER